MSDGQDFYLVFNKTAKPVCLTHQAHEPLLQPVCSVELSRPMCWHGFSLCFLSLNLESAFHQTSGKQLLPLYLQIICQTQRLFHLVFIASVFIGFLSSSLVPSHLFCPWSKQMWSFLSLSQTCQRILYRGKVQKALPDCPSTASSFPARPPLTNASQTHSHLFFEYDLS